MTITTACLRGRLRYSSRGAHRSNTCPGERQVGSVHDCVLRPAHRKPLHPAPSPCQSRRRLSSQVPAAAAAAAARWGGHRCPARAPRAGVPLACPPRLAAPSRRGPPASAAPVSTSQEPPGEPAPPPQPAARPRPAPPRPPSLPPPSSSRASPVITTGLPPRAAPVVRGRPQACVGGRPETPRAPGRAPGSRVQAALQAAPLTPARPSARQSARPRGQVPAPLAPRGAPTRAVPSTRRLPEHTPGQSHQSRRPAATPARARPPARSLARRPPSAAPRRAAPRRGPLSPPPRPRPRLQILPRRLCSTRTSRLSSSPVSGSAVPGTAGASGEAAAAAAGAAAAMVPPGPYRSPTACVAGRGGARRGLGRIEPRSGPAPASGWLAPPPRAVPARPAPLQGPGSSSRPWAKWFGGKPKGEPWLCCDPQDPGSWASLTNGHLDPLMLKENRSLPSVRLQVQRKSLGILTNVQQLRCVRDSSNRVQNAPEDGDKPLTQPLL